MWDGLNTLYVHGMFQPIPPDRANAAASRFWKYVNIPSQNEKVCWLWTGSTDRYGYGVLGLGTRVEGQRRAHRLSWVICHQADPGPLWVLHHCDTPLCVRPSHLYLGDRQANVQDMYSRDRRASEVIAEQFRGEKHYRTHLTEDIVREIRSKQASGRSYSQLANEYGLSKSGVTQIVKRRTWKHVS